MSHSNSNSKTRLKPPAQPSWPSQPASRSPTIGPSQLPNYGLLHLSSSPLASPRRDPARSAPRPQHTPRDPSPSSPLPLPHQPHSSAFPSPTSSCAAPCSHAASARTRTRPQCLASLATAVLPRSRHSCSHASRSRPPSLALVPEP
jgi:hypothetical protein